MNYPSLSLKQDLIEQVFSEASYGNGKQMKEQTASSGSIRMKKYYKEQKEQSVQNAIVEKCEKCDYKSSKFKAMYRHMKETHGLKQHCTDCEFSHFYPNRVKRHYDRVHRGFYKGIKQERHYLMKCRKESCEFVGTKKCSDLQSHKLFYCEKCPASFERNDYLKFHNERIHEGVVYNCKYCDMTKSKKGDLKRHILSTHSNEDQGQNRKPTFCKEEGCSFKTLNGQLKQHIERKHDGIVRFKCSVMNCNFGTVFDKRDIVRHTKTH